jgi:hypothetical protein
MPPNKPLELTPLRVEQEHFRGRRYTKTRALFLKFGSEG